MQSPFCGITLLRKTFGCTRKVYNLILGDNVKKHGKGNEWDGEWDQHTPAEYKEVYPYLSGVDALALANAQLDAENAIANHRKNPGYFGFPNFRAKHFSKKSYTTNIVHYKKKGTDAEGNEVLVDSANIELSANYLKLPKLGWLKLRLHRQIPAGAAIKSVTITELPSGAVYVSILTERIEKIRKGFYENICEEAEVAKTKPSVPFRTLSCVGLDYSSPHLKVRGSKNYQKLKKKIAKTQEHIRNQRRDWQEKEATKLARRYDVIAVEDLDYKGLAQSLSLGKSTNDNAFGQFLTILKRKMEAKCGAVITISKWEPTTKQCQCGYVNPDVVLGMQRIECPVCGRIYDRDQNAAMNILKAGVKILLEEINNRGSHGVCLSGEIRAGSSILLDIG